MTDVVVTLPLSFGLGAWIAEGDPAGTPWSGHEWHWYTGGLCPQVAAGERVYVVHAGRLRGYAPLVRVERDGPRSCALVRGGGAVAVTIDQEIQGFRGCRYRWWRYDAERPYPDWRTP